MSNIHTVGRFSGEDLEFYKCRYSGSADGNWAVPKKRARPYDLVAALIPARELRLRVSQFEAYFSRGICRCPLVSLQPGFSLG